eukprot:10752710-Alexandrium_andersonii.AAC.1
MALVEPLVGADPVQDPPIRHLRQVRRLGKISPGRALVLELDTGAHGHLRSILGFRHEVRAARGSLPRVLDVRP